MFESLGLSMVKNEADIIEASVRHNLHYLDVLAIIDNDSIDGTREIIVELQKEGLPVILFDDPTVAYFQSEKMTALYRRLVPNFNPRFVFLLDADEFITAPSREALYQELRELRPGTLAGYFWQTYIPSPERTELSGCDPLRDITHRQAVERHYLPKMIIATDPAINMELRVAQGNHDVTVNDRSLPCVILRDAALAHFPIRSVDQLTGKVLAGWIANMERNLHDKDRGFGAHWKKLFDKIVDGPGLSGSDLTNLAFGYGQFSSATYEWPRDVVYEPIQPRYEHLSGQPKVPYSPLRKVMKTIDKIYRQRSDGNLGGAQIGEIFDNSKPLRQSIDIPPFRFLAERHEIQTVLEIGNSPGAYMHYFASMGAKGASKIWHPEGDSGAFAEVIGADDSQTFERSRTFELVICVNATEVLPHAADRGLVDELVRYAANRIVFCDTRQKGAETGSDMASSSTWIKFFEAIGWYPQLFESLAMRALSTSSWLAANLIVFSRDESQTGIYWHPLIAPKQSIRPGDVEPISLRRASLNVSTNRSEAPAKPHHLGKANHYFEIGEFAKACEHYTAYLNTGGGPAHENYLAQYGIAESLTNIEASALEVERAFDRAARIRPDRAEPLYDSAYQHRVEKRYRLGYLFAKSAAEIPLPAAAELPVRHDVYAFRALDERAVCASWIGKHPEAFALWRRLLTRSDLPQADRQRIAANRDICVPAMIARTSTYPDQIVRSMPTQKSESDVTVSLVADSNRSRTEASINSFIHCCTDIASAGRVVVLDTGLSPEYRNLIADRYGFLEISEPLTDSPPSNLAQFRSRIHTRFWLHVDGYQFFAPEALITRLREVLRCEPTLHQVGINLGDSSTLTGISSAEEVTHRTISGYRYVLTDRLALGPSMFDLAMLDRNGGLSRNDVESHIEVGRNVSRIGARAASLDEVLCIAHDL